MKRSLISLFISLTVLVALAACSKSATKSSSKPERTVAPAPKPVPASLPTLGDMTPPPDFVPFDKEPHVVKSAVPIYPETARKAGLEGTVWVKIWVDKTGRAKTVVIQQSASEIFDEAAIAAAKQFVFTPAVLNGAPTDVWVSIPFYFRLK